MSKITQTSKVLMHFTLTLDDGSVAESTEAMGKPARFGIGDGSLTPQLEQCLLGLGEGEKHRFTLEPDEAFGVSDPDKIHHFARSQFGNDAPAEIGNIIAFTDVSGNELPGVITEVAGDSVTVDFNHPLAGQRVTFDVEVMAIEN